MNKLIVGLESALGFLPIKHTIKRVLNAIHQVREESKILSASCK